MPPKQATRKAPPKGYAYASEDEFETLLDKSPGISLPAVPTAPNWNYGGPSSIALPKSSPVNPMMSYQRIAQRIQIGKEMAERRDFPRSRDAQQDDQSPVQRQPRTRARREPAADSGSPIRRRTKREPTPDQTQLLQSLRQATASPIRESTNQPSDATPSPPVPHPVSTDSEPDAQPPRPRRLSMVEVSQLYPSPLQRVGDLREAPFESTPDRQGSVDNASEVSWNLERDIHEDNLQRTRPSKYRGRNITKPPRRPSGLAIVQETTDEEEEPTTVPVVEHVVEAAESWTAPARTIIPQIFRRSRSPENNPGPISPKEGLVERWLSSLRPESRDGRPLEPKPWANWVRVAVLLLLPLLLIFSFQSGYLEKLPFSFPVKESSLQLPPNITESEIFYGLRNQVSRANAQISSLSQEISSVRSEHAKDPRPTFIVDPLAAPKPVPKINFLSPQLGAIVDPRNSTPTAGRVPSLTERLLARLSVGRTSSARGPLPPAAALTHWEDVGDCWCTTPRDGVSQLSVFLNYYIVPEEVVVEHIPTGATPNPGVAPQNIEVWARFRIVPMDKGKPSPEATRAIGPSSARQNGLGGYNIPGEATLHDVLMNSLRVSHPHEDESAYSDDPLLGPNFYRVGKMKYDISKEDHMQRFSLNTIVDVPTIRVDKVVFRFTSNWGSNHTCIYRLRLHGHV